jgi:phosphate:Na+ symporter
MVGMKLLSSGLEQSAGEGMKRLFKKVGPNPAVNIGVGALFTAICESSAATTVMTIGFVNAGAMTLLQATYVIMGANVGTTVTGVIVSLSAFDVATYAALLSFVGVVMTFFKADSVKKIGQILMGFGLVFVGMSLMKEAFNEQEVKDVFYNVFSSISFPLLMVLIGALFTALIQSSTTTTGLLIIMVSGGAIELKSAFFIVLGANIGTCMTAFIASAGTSTNAKRTALIHLLFNFIGGFAFFLLLLFLGDWLSGLLASIFVGQPGMQLAWFHVIFNLTTTLALLPFGKVLALIATKLIKQRAKEKEHIVKYIDERLLATPPLAVAQVKKEIIYMAQLARDNLQRAFDDLKKQNDEHADEILKTEEIIDFTNNELTAYLIKLSPLVSGKDEKRVGSYFHVVNDIERIGDHAENFLDINREMKKKDVLFGNAAKEEVLEMYGVIRQMFDVALEIFENNDVKKLSEISAFEDKSDALKKSLTDAHIERMSAGECSPEVGAYFYSAVAGLERVADHLVNVAYSIDNPTGAQETAK